MLFQAFSDNAHISMLVSKYQSLRDWIPADQNNASNKTVQKGYQLN